MIIKSIIINLVKAARKSYFGHFFLFRLETQLSKRFKIIAELMVPFSYNDLSMYREYEEF